MLLQALGIWCGCMLEALLGKNEELKGVFTFFCMQYNCFIFIFDDYTMNFLDALMPLALANEKNQR